MKMMQNDNEKNNDVSPSFINPETPQENKQTAINNPNAEGSGAPPFPAPPTTSPPPTPTATTQPTTEEQNVIPQSGTTPPQGMDMNEPKDNLNMSQVSPVQPQDKPIETAGQSNMQQVVTEKEGGSKFKIIMIILIVIAVIIYGVVAYLYFDNQSLEEELVSQDQASVVPAQVTQPTTAPETFQYLIDNGNIKKSGSQGTEEIIISKNNVEGVGITGFINVVASPNENYLCFWSLPPSLSPALYYADIGGLDVTQIAEAAKSCVWSNSEEQVAYINDEVEGNPVDIFLYTLETALSENLTNQTATGSGVFRRYEATGFSGDDTKILCNYEEISTENPALESLGTCEIDVLSGEVTDL